MPLGGRVLVRKQAASLAEQHQPNVYWKNTETHLHYRHKTTQNKSHSAHIWGGGVWVGEAPRSGEPGKGWGSRLGVRGSWV